MGHHRSTRSRGADRQVLREGDRSAGRLTVVNAGEVTCVLGDNGAGKSTLIKILSGVHQHDEGEFLVDGGTPLPPRASAGPRHRHGVPGPRDGPADVGLAELLPRLGADEGVGPPKRFDITARKITRSELRRMGIDLRDPDQPVGTLSGGERQCGRDRPRGLLRRPRADPRRADPRWA